MKPLRTFVLLLLLSMKWGFSAAEMKEYVRLDMRNGLPETRVRTLDELADGRIVIATAGTITLHDGVNFEVYHLYPEYEYELTDYHNKRSLTCDSMGMIWLRNDGSLFVVDSRRHRLVTDIDSLLRERHLTPKEVSEWYADMDWRDKDDYQPLDTLFDEEISNYLYDSNGGLWIGLLESGLLYHHPKRLNQFHSTSTPYNYKSAPQFCSQRATRLANEFAPLATNCSLGGTSLPYTYLGTRYGVLIINKENELVATIDSRYGLSTDNVVSMIADRHKDVWAVTANGISRIHTAGRDSFRITNYGLLDGIDTKGREFVTCQIHADEKGWISVGNPGGTCVFHPDSVNVGRYAYSFPDMYAESDAAPLSHLWWNVPAIVVVCALIGLVMWLRKRSERSKHKRMALVAEQPVPAAMMARKIAEEAAEENLRTADSTFLERLRSIIEENLSDESFSVQSLSERMAMDRTVLYRHMQAETGMSPSAYIRSIRMEVARRLLKESDMTISEIAYKSGYSTTKYFSASFKETFGMTPGEFRTLS